MKMKELATNPIDTERLLDNLKTMKSNLAGDNSLFKFFPKNYLYWLNEAIKYIELDIGNQNE